jgi:hypothetical protein
LVRRCQRKEHTQDSRRRNDKKHNQRIRANRMITISPPSPGLLQGEPSPEDRPEPELERVKRKSERLGKRGRAKCGIPQPFCEKSIRI